MIESENIHEENGFNELKSLWKNQPEEEKYNKSEIFGMIHRKSINSVQWLFIISILEMLFGLIIWLWSYFSGGHYYSDKVIQKMGEENVYKLEYFSNFGIVFSLILMGIIFYYYRRISSDMAVGTLIRNIIQFRKAVIICLIAVVILVLIFMLPIYYDIGKHIAMENYSSTNNELNEKAELAGNMSGWIMAATSTFVIAVFFFIYYYLIYGLFLRRLNRNLKELREINK